MGLVGVLRCAQDDDLKIDSVAGWGGDCTDCVGRRAGPGEAMGQGCD
jgi:hypothetical protein